MNYKVKIGEIFVANLNIFDENIKGMPYEDWNE